MQTHIHTTEHTMIYINKRKPLLNIRARLSRIVITVNQYSSINVWRWYNTDQLLILSLKQKFSHFFLYFNLEIKICHINNYSTDLVTLMRQHCWHLLDESLMATLSFWMTKTVRKHVTQSTLLTLYNLDMLMSWYWSFPGYWYNWMQVIHTDLLRHIHLEKVDF